MDRENMKQRFFWSEFGSVEPSPGHDSLHSFLDFFGEFEGRELLLQLAAVAIATAVAVEATGHVRGDEVSVGEVQGLADVVLLTQEVLLVVIFSVVKLVCLCDLGLDLLGQLLLPVLSRLVRQLALRLIVVEDGGHVLPGRAARGVVVLPEQLQHLAVGGDLRVKGDLHGLRVVAKAVISWSLLLPPSETHPRLEDPRGTPKLCLGEPKSAQSESGHLCLSTIQGESSSLFNQSILNRSCALFSSVFLAEGLSDERHCRKGSAVVLAG